MWAHRSSSRGRATLGRELVLATCVLMFSCDESMPPREDPQGFLQATLSAEGGIVAVASDSSIVRGGWLIVHVKNTYNEVLQADAQIQVDVDLWRLDAPDERTSVRMSEQDVAGRWLVRNGLTTLPPDSIALIVKDMNHNTSSGIPFWSLVRLNPRPTKDGTVYCESGAVPFGAKASVKLFKSVAPIETNEVHFVVVYQVLGITCGEY
jgi:hypothetical protein